MERGGTILNGDGEKKNRTMRHLTYKYRRYTTGRETYHSLTHSIWTLHNWRLTVKQSFVNLDDESAPK